MEIKITRIFIAGILYIYLAIPVFFFGWLKPGYAAAASLLLCLGIYAGVRSWIKEEQKEENRNIYMTKTVLLLGMAFVLFMCWHTGIGGFTGQVGDWHKHNAVMHDLIERRWPVIYSTEYGDSMLSYYIGYYLIPAVCGKLTSSFRMAEIVQYLLSAGGIYLLWLIVVNVCRAKSGKRQLICLGMIFMFGGMMLLGQAVCSNLYPESLSYGSMEWMNPETVTIQYSPNWSLLKWVPGQVIVPWIATALLLCKPDKTDTYVLIGMPVILYSGFAMTGLAVMMAALCICYIFLKKERNIRNVFSLSNLLLAFGTGSILILYFLGNIMGEKPEYLSFHMLDYGQKKIFYFLFAFFMFGGYTILVFKENKKNILYWITVAGLLVYPLFSMGAYNDFTMRASIPGLFTLMILCLRFLFFEEEGMTGGRNLTVRKTLLAAGLIIAMVYPVLNIRESIVKNVIGEHYRTDGYLSLESYADPSDEEIPDDLKYNYYSYDLERDIFYRYLAKQQKK